MKFPRPKFSLRSQLILVLLIGSAGGLWYRWAPWHVVKTIPGRAEISADHKKLLTVTFKQSSDELILWDFDTLAEEWKIECKNPPRTEPRYRFEIGNRWIFCHPRGYDGQEGQKRLFDIRTGKEYLNPALEMSEIRVLEGGKLAIVSPAGQYPKLWDIVLGTFHEINVTDMKNFFGDRFHADLTNIIFTPDGSQMIGEHNGLIRIWNTQTGSHTKELNGIDAQLWSDGRTLSYYANKRQKHIFDVVSGSESTITHDGHWPENPVSPDGRLMLLNEAAPSQNLCGYELSSQKLLWKIPGVSTNSQAQWVQNSILLTNMFSSESIVVNLQTGTMQKFLSNSSFSPDAQRVMQCGGETLSIFDANDGTTLFESTEYIFSTRVGFSANGAKVAYLDDNVVKILMRCRPEQWWGIAWLPEAWLVLATGLGLVWSLRRDWKGWRRSASDT